MRTILLIALFLNSYRIFAPGFEDGSCLVVQPWTEWMAIPLLFITLFLDARAMALRYHALRPWRIKRQEYLRLRRWVSIHSDARGRV